MKKEEDEEEGEEETISCFMDKFKLYETKETRDDQTLILRHLN